MKKFLLYLSVFAMVVSLLLFTFLSDEQSNSYTSLEAIKTDNAIERGWIPAIIPASAYDIVETHNLDTNVFYGSFYYKEKDETTFIKHLSPIEENDSTYMWEDTLFHIDKKLHKVWYRNKAAY